MKRMYFVMMLCVLLFACKPEAEKPTVVTLSIDDVTETTAKIVGEVVADGGAYVKERGVCWDTMSAPEILDNRIVVGTGLGIYSADVVGLEPNTTYYVRAYATNEKGTSYGGEKTFITEEIEEPETPEEPDGPVGPIVTTFEVSDITEVSATCRGEVVGGSDVVIVSRGVCYSITPTPTLSDNYTVEGSGFGGFVSDINDLSSHTTYYVRAYATDANDVVSYGEEVVFTTLDKYKGHEYVDLGLPSGLKWATCNVGAENFTDSGDYFAWGEISPKTEYTEENCSIVNGQAMSDISGNPQYDAAAANWGGSWRMPTGEEMVELIENCEWVLNLDGGITVTGPNGRSIFLPRAGLFFYDFVGDYGTKAYYWTSTPCVYVHVEEYGRISCNYDPNTNYNGICLYTNYHYNGYCVRPVTE